LEEVPIDAYYLIRKPNALGLRGQVVEEEAPPGSAMQNITDTMWVVQDRKKYEKYAASHPWWSRI
jgi:hypothetical protein